MPNETTLTFEAIRQTTTNFPFMIALLIVWLLPIFFWLIYGSIKDGKSGGRPISKKGFWVAFILWFFIQGALITFLIYYPIWSKML